MPLVRSCIESRLHDVVFPLDDGPAMSTIFTFFLAAISSAICAIFFSCRASERFMRSVVIPLSTASFRSPMVRSASMSCQWWCSLKISNILSWCISSPSCPGSLSDGMRSSSPSKYFSSPKSFSCDVLVSSDP